MSDTTPEATVVAKYDNVDKLNMDVFLRTALKEMLVADSDTLNLEAGVTNTDGSITKIKFDLIITELVNETAK
jgi:hypothetical protein